MRGCRRWMLVALLAAGFILVGPPESAGQRAQKELRPGKVQVVGRYPKRRRKDGRKVRRYFLLRKGGEFKLRVGGPASVLFLARGMGRGRVTLKMDLDGKKEGQVKLNVLPRKARQVAVEIPEGTHQITMVPSRRVLIYPALSKGRPGKNVRVVAWKDVPAPPGEPEKWAESPPPAPPEPGEDDALAVPVPIVPPGEEKAAPAPPVAAKPPVEPEKKPEEKPEKRPEEKPVKIAAPVPVPEARKPRPPAPSEPEKVTEHFLPPPPPPKDPTGPGDFGQRGIYRAWSAEANHAGTVAVGASMGFFKANDFLASGDEHQRMTTRFTVAGVPLSGLEVNAGFSMAKDDNTHHSFDPADTQTAGDPFLGVRYGIAPIDWFSLGLGIQALIPSGKGLSELAPEGISTRILFAFDFRPTPELLLALNTGYHFDNSKLIFDHETNEVQRFSAGINPHDQLLVQFGAAYQVGPVAPFLEYGSAVAMGGGAPGFADSPNWLTVGLRAWPLNHHTFHVLAAVDVGLTGVDAPAGKARIPPYNVVLAAGYTFGVAPPKTKVREVVRVEKVKVPVEVPTKLAAPTGRITGKVVDANTGDPVGNAKVVVSGKTPAVLLSDSAEGRFLTCPAKPGPVKLSVYREGYRDKDQVVLVGGEAEVPVTIELQPSTGQTFGVLKGTVRAVTGVPLRALISIPTRKVMFRATRRTGKFRRKLATGTFDVMISMPGYVTQRRKVKLSPGDVIILNVDLYPER